jgi:signal transduction histidine kinase
MFNIHVIGVSRIQEVLAMLFIDVIDADRVTGWAFISDRLADYGITDQQALDDCCLCVGEALQNVRRYSESKVAHIAVTESDTAVIVRISDDGLGFDCSMLPEPAPLQIGGYGVSIIKRLYGRDAVQSAVGCGTVVTMRVSK